jgi:SAM-dependent methyltransferase
MEIYASKTDKAIVDWQWYEPSLRNITHLILKNVPKTRGLALDVGCGTGRVAFALAKLGFEVEGIDANERAIEIANQINENVRAKIDFHSANFNSETVEKEKYDLAVCSEVLEHVEDYKPLIKGMLAALKPKGRLIVTVPFDPKKWSVLDEYGGHVRRYTIEQIREDLSQFENHEIIITGFPFYRILTRTYLAKIKFFKQEHSNEALWESPKTQLIAKILYPFMRIDNLFAFTKLGDALIISADKPGENV